VARYEGRKAYFNTTHSKVCGDRKEEWEDETMKKLEIIQDYNKFT
jgi:hypothetical protein